jgi:DNA primase catalytic core
MSKFKDIDIVKQVLKDGMDLNDLIRLADAKFTRETGIKCNEIEMVNEELYKKQCDLDTHPADADGTRDSTASFTICPQKELFYCFGCGAGGDRFEYISIRFNVSFIEAVEMVAEIEGINLTPYYEELSPHDIILNSLFRENSDAVDLAHSALLADERALAYLRGRGITDESIELFRLGYAPPIKGRIDLFDSIPNRAVLQLERVDQFNDAILFPITDVYGKTRYFQSRPFNPMPGMKYIGGNDSHPLFEETDRIFGFNVIRKNLYKNGGKVVGVEGAPDTIACVQVGIPACGFLGTVCNQNTFDLLAKYRVTELTLLLDGDKAGRLKSFTICEKYLSINTSVRLKVATIPNGDPDEYINEFGGDALKEIIASAPYAIQYLVDMKWNDAKTPTEKMTFIDDIKKYMNAVTDKITKNIMYFDIAAKLGLDPIQVEDYYTQAMASTTGGNLYAPDGEETLLGEVIRNPDFITELTMRFKDDDWYLSKHKYLFKIFKQSQYTDIESIHTIARNMNLDSIITMEWLTRIANKTGNIEFIIRDVEDKLIRRKTILIADKIKVSANDMSQDMEIALDRSTNEIYNTAHKGIDEQVFSSKHQVSSAMRLVHDRMKNPNKIIGFSYGAGFQKLDMATLGLQKKTLTVVAANQSVGKTQLCENWAMSQSVIDMISTLWFSLEMDEDRMTFRNLSLLSGVPCTPIMTGNLTVEWKDRLDGSAVLLENSPFHLSDIGHDLSEALAIARRYVMKEHVEIIYIDYIQLQYVTDRKTNQRHQELGWISKAWKQFAKDMNVAVVLISQLSKEALKAETAEAEHGAGSYEIAQDADNYITLKEKSAEDIAKNGIDQGNIMMNVSKNRMGEKEILIPVYADRPIHRICEV